MLGGPSGCLLVAGEVLNDIAVAGLEPDGSLDASSPATARRPSMSPARSTSPMRRPCSRRKLVLAGRAGDPYDVDVGLVRLLLDGQVGRSVRSRCSQEVDAGNWWVTATRKAGSDNSRPSETALISTTYRGAVGDRTPGL